MHGGDGRSHNVPVRWTEYINVQRESAMVVAEREDGKLDTCDTQMPNGEETTRQFFERRGGEYGYTIFRRSIHAAIPH